MKDYATPGSRDFFRRTIDQAVVLDGYPDGETFALARVFTPQTGIPAGWYYLERATNGTVWAWHGTYHECEQRFEQSSEFLKRWREDRDV